MPAVFARAPNDSLLPSSSLSLARVRTDEKKSDRQDVQGGFGETQFVIHYFMLFPLGIYICRIQGERNGRVFPRPVLGSVQWEGTGKGIKVSL